jgi:transcriptional regulator with GAF, ATPase, and Fis domain
LLVEYFIDRYGKKVGKKFRTIDKRTLKEMIEAALAESYGRVSGPDGAAARLGIPARTLDSKIKRLGINKHRFKA